MRMSDRELVELYADAALRHGKARFGSDPSAGNADADRIAAIYRALRLRGAEFALLPLLEDPDDGVRGWAAAHALEFAPADGEPVLERLADSPEAGLVGFSAEVTLREWHEGRLHFS